MDILRKAFPEDPCDAIKMYSAVTINLNNEIAFSCWLRNLVKIFASWFPGGLTVAIRIDHVDRVENVEEDHINNDDNEPEEQLHDDDLIVANVHESNDEDTDESSEGEYGTESTDNSDNDDGNGDQNDDQVQRFRPGQVIHRETKLEIVCNIGRNHDI